MRHCKDHPAARCAPERCCANAADTPIVGGHAHAWMVSGLVLPHGWSTTSYMIRCRLEEPTAEPECEALLQDQTAEGPHAAGGPTLWRCEYLSNSDVPVVLALLPSGHNQRPHKQDPGCIIKPLTQTALM